MLLANFEFILTESKIDSEITFKNFLEIVDYLPTAIINGFLQPLPVQWLEQGKEVGRIGRIISGFETVVWYSIIFGFFYIAIINRSVLSPLIPILLTSILIIILLGYVVPNTGAIYRMRQGPMIPFYIIGIYGLQLLFNKRL